MQALLDLQNERMHREQLKLEVRAGACTSQRGTAGVGLPCFTALSMPNRAIAAAVQILNAEHSSAAAKKLAAEVQALQRKLAGVVKKQVATAASLQSKLDQATSECTQLRGQLAAAEQKVGWRI